MNLDEIEREMMLAFDKAAGRAIRDGIVEGFRAAEAVRAKHFATVRREMTAGQRDAIAKILELIGEKGPSFRADAFEVFQALLAGEVRLFADPEAAGSGPAPRES